MLLAKRTVWTGPDNWNIFQELQSIEYSWYMDVKQEGMERKYWGKVNLDSGQQPNHGLINLVMESV